MCDLFKCNVCINRCKNNATDKEIEKLWEDLADIPIDEDECLDIDWQGWSKGTHREEIWHWFDEHHSKGVGWLMNDFIKKKVDISIVADETYEAIISKDFENFDQYEEVSKITNLEVAKKVIKKLLEERYEREN